MKRFGRRDASLMQIAAAVVGSAAAAQVIGPSEEMIRQADEHTYLTGERAGVNETAAGDRLDLVGVNERRLIALWTDEGVWVGGCLITNRADAEYLAAFLTREADE
jgi:hypothetical protein